MKLHSGSRTLLASLLLLGVLVLAGSSVAAERGVGVNVGTLEVGTALEPGRGYFLPRFGVINTGDQPTGYELSVSYLEDQPERRPDEGWFSFSPKQFQLEPGQSRDIRVEINLPAGAQAGDYFVLLRAQTVSEGETGTQLGVAAATRLSFTVEQAGWLDAQRHRFNRWLDDYYLWLVGALALLVLAFLATRARRFPIRIRVERK